MTYWGYHLAFTIPLIILFTYRLRKHIRRAHIVCWLAICFIAFVYTTPWDNYAVWLGIWGFGENVSLGYPFSQFADSTSLIGHIPFEEYAFFIIETTLVCLVALYFLPHEKK